MFDLPTTELVVFGVVLILAAGAAAIGVMQLFGLGAGCGRILLPLVALVVTLEAVLLVFRAVAIKTVPLTELFESMIVLAMAFGVVYLFLSIGIEQVWFGSVMAWTIFAILLLAATVARPAAEPREAAATPWAVVHAVAMLLAGTSIALSTAGAFLYLFASRRLKAKKVMQVLGKVPNIEKLKGLNLFGLRAGFALLTFGLASGVGLAAVKSTALGMGLLDWLTDSKIVLIAVSWILLAVILILRRAAGLKDKTIAQITMVVFFLILFAIVGATLFCKTKHNFSAQTPYSTLSRHKTCRHETADRKLSIGQSNTLRGGKRVGK